MNYAKEDKDRALEILQLAKSNEIIKKLPGYTSFIYLNTALIYYYQEKYTSAKTNISRLIQQVDFLSLDVVFQFKLLIVELIIRLKLDQNDIIIQKTKDIKSNYINILSDKKYHRDVLVLETIGKIINGEKIDKKNLLIALGNQLEIDIIDYTDWAKSV